jgi:hypothetical protein
LRPLFKFRKRRFEVPKKAFEHYRRVPGASSC